MRTKAFIICEDIRRELGQKSSLMGILNDSLHFNGPDADVWPKAINLAVFIQIALEEDDQLPNEFELNVTIDGDDVATVKGEVSLSKDIKTLNVPIALNGFPLKSTGLVVFNFKLLRQGRVLIEEENTLKIATIGTSEIDPTDDKKL